MDAPAYTLNSGVYLFKTETDFRTIDSGIIIGVNWDYENGNYIYKIKDEEGKIHHLTPEDNMALTKNGLIDKLRTILTADGQNISWDDLKIKLKIDAFNTTQNKEIFEKVYCAHNNVLIAGAIIGKSLDSSNNYFEIENYIVEIENITDKIIKTIGTKLFFTVSNCSDYIVNHLDI